MLVLHLEVSRSQTKTYHSESSENHAVKIRVQCMKSQISAKVLISLSTDPIRSVRPAVNVKMTVWDRVGETLSRIPIRRPCRALLDSKFVKMKYSKNPGVRRSAGGKLAELLHEFFADNVLVLFSSARSRSVATRPPA